MTVQHVYTAIAAVMADIGKEGIGKDRKNTQQGYSFRGIDEVLNALSPLLSKHKLCILPRVVARECVERTSKRGDALFSVAVEAEFDFVSAEDGSKHTVKTFGEAMDSADKATNKAMSAAYKYAAFQAFCIPVEGDNDADATTHEVASSKPKAEKKAPPKQDIPPEMMFTPEESAAERLRLVNEIGELSNDRAALHDWAKENSYTKGRLTPKDANILKAVFALKQKAIQLGGEMTVTEREPGDEQGAEQ